jgi:transposase InsO family protein
MKVTLSATPVIALFDTGASISVMNWKTFLRLPNRPQLKQDNIAIRAANGTNLKVRGSALFPLTIGNRSTTRPIIVVEKLNTDLILGSDTIAAENLLIDVAAKKIIHKPNLSPTLISATAKNAVTLQPHEEKLCTLRPSTPVPRNAQILVNPEGDLASLYQLAPALVNPNSDGTVTTVVTNPTSMAQTFEPNTIIAELEVISQSNQILNIDSLRHEAQPQKQSITPKDVKLDHLPDDYKPKYLQLLNQFSDVLSLNVNEVGNATAVKQRITLKDPNKIASTPPYRLPVHLKEVALQYVRTLLDAGIIRKSTSPFCSPLLLVKKPHAQPDAPLVSQYRVCHDFRRLNALQIRDSYPLHNLYDLLDSVARAKLWTVIDLSNGFFNQQLEEDSKKFTAFGIPGVGHWEYNRSAQGLCNSAAAFQRLLDYVIQGLKQTFVYVDDCIICADTHDEMLERMKQLFLRFRKYSLKCRVSKLQIGAAQIHYLGYDLTREHGIRPGIAKTAALQQWKPPTDVTQIRAFLGLASFFRRTVKNFAQIANPLTKLTRKDANFKGTLTPDALQAFNTLKQILSTRPALRPTDFSKPFIVTTDASNKGFGAILSQIDDQGVEHPCAYASRALSSSQENWAPYHKEHAAMLFACKQFKPYLVGKEFTIRTDHKPLTTLNNKQAQCIERIREQMDEFQPFKIEYLKGKTMPADGLSRYCFQIDTPQPGHELTHEQLYHLQNQCHQAKAIACQLKFKVTPLNQRLKSIVKSWVPHAFIKDKLVHIKRNGAVKIFAPTPIRHTLIQLAHDSPVAGHFSAQKTLDKLAPYWEWPRMGTDIREHCLKCHQCQTNVPSKIDPQPLRQLKMPAHFNDIIQSDLLGPLPNIDGYKYLMIITDRYSRFMTAVPMKDKTAQTAAQALMQGWISKHGSCNLLITDRGKEYANEIFQELARRFNFTHNFASAGHPQSNGLTERLNRTVIQYFRKCLNGSNDWLALLPPFELAYNSTPHASTKLPPYVAAFNRYPKTPFTPHNPPEYSDQQWKQNMASFNKIHHLILKNLQTAYSEQKSYFDRRARQRSFEPNDLVFVTRPHSGTQFQKFQPTFMGPYRIGKLLPNDNLGLIRISDNKLFTVHKNRVIMARYQDQLYPESPKIDEPQTQPSDTPDDPIIDDDDVFPQNQPQPAPANIPAQPAPQQAAHPANPVQPAAPNTPPQQQRQHRPQTPPAQQQQPYRPLTPPTQFQPIPNAPPIDAGGHNIRRTPDRDNKRVTQLKKQAQQKRTREQQGLVAQEEQTLRTEAEYQHAKDQSKQIYQHKGHLTRREARDQGITPAVVLNPPSDSDSSTESIPAPPQFEDPTPTRYTPSCRINRPAAEAEPGPPAEPQPSTSTAPPPTIPGHVPTGRQLPRTP